jgi:hypothetical protein
MRHVKLGDLLPAEALAQIEALAESGKCTAEHLRPITNRYRDELLAKEVDADYLAYAIEYVCRREAMS